MNGLTPELKGGKRFHDPADKQDERPAKISSRIDALTHQCTALHAAMMQHLHRDKTACSCNEEELKREIRLLEAEYYSLLAKLQPHPFTETPPSSFLPAPLQKPMVIIQENPKRKLLRLDDPVRNLSDAVLECEKVCLDLVKTLSSINYNCNLGHLGSTQWILHESRIAYLKLNFGNIQKDRSKINGSDPRFLEKLEFWSAFLKIFCDFPHATLSSSLLKFLEIPEEKTHLHYRVTVYRQMKNSMTSGMIRDRFLTACLIWKMENPTKAYPQAISSLIEKYSKTKMYFMTVEKNHAEQISGILSLALTQDAFVKGLEKNNSYQTSISDKTEIIYCPDSSVIQNSRREDEPLEPAADRLYSAVMHLLADVKGSDQASRSQKSQRAASELITKIKEGFARKNQKSSGDNQEFAHGIYFTLLLIASNQRQKIPLENGHTLEVASPFPPLACLLKGMLKDVISRNKAPHYFDILSKALRAHTARSELPQEIRELLEKNDDQAFEEHMSSIPVHLAFAREGSAPIIAKTTLKKLNRYFREILSFSCKNRLQADLAIYLHGLYSLEPQKAATHPYYQAYLNAIQSSAAFEETKEMKDESLQLIGENGSDTSDDPGSEASALEAATSIGMDGAKLAKKENETQTNPHTAAAATPMVLDAPKAPIPKLIEKESVRINGLPNIGNSCYINASLQALFSSATFLKYLTEAMPKEEPEKLLRAKLEELKSQLSPKAILKMNQIREILFDHHMHPDYQQNKGQQQDAETLVSTVLNACGYKMMQRETRFATYENQKLTTSSIESLPLFPVSISDEPAESFSLEALLAQTVIEEKDDTKNAWEYRLESRKIYFSKYQIERKFTGSIPPLVVIQLKRFKTKGENSEKIEVPIDVPDVLDLSKMMDPELLRENNNIRYNLVASVNHIGTNPRRGHYVAYALRNGNWYYFNDEDAKKIAPYNVMKEQAYLLLYERQTANGSL